MERVELFDKYITNQLSEKDRIDFENQLKADKSFASDFKIYLFAVKGVQKENEEKDMELGIALKKITKAQLQDIVGRKSQPKMLRLRYLRERLAWASSVAAILIVGFFTVLSVHNSSRNQLYDTIAEYNYVPSTDRYNGNIIDINSISEKELKTVLPELEKAYREVPSDDVQSGEDAGMRLAMAYLRLHNKKKTVEILTKLKSQYSDDEDFVSQCNRILNQIK